MFETLGRLSATALLTLAVLAVAFGLLSLLMDRVPPFSRQDGLENTIMAGVGALVCAGVTLVLGLVFIVGVTIQR